MIVKYAKDSKIQHLYSDQNWSFEFKPNANWPASVRYRSGSIPNVDGICHPSDLRRNNIKMQPAYYFAEQNTMYPDGYLRSVRISSNGKIPVWEFHCRLTTAITMNDDTERKQGDEKKMCQASVETGWRVKKTSSVFFDNLKNDCQTESRLQSGPDSSPVGTFHCSSTGPLDQGYRVRWYMRPDMRWGLKGPAEEVWNSQFPSCWLAGNQDKL